MRFKKTAFFLVILLSHFISAQLYAQEIDLNISPEQGIHSWDQLFSQLEKDNKITYKKADFENVEFVKIDSIVPLEDFFSQAGFQIIRIQGQGLFILPTEFLSSLSEDIYPLEIKSEEKSTRKQKTSAFKETKSQHIADVVVIGTRKNGIGKSTCKLTGVILDGATREAIIGATLIIKESNTGTATDFDGSYELTLDKGTSTITISDLNHEDRILRVEMLSDGEKDIFMESQAVLLEGVTVTADKFNKIESTSMGFERLTTKAIKEIPLVLGERDILKVASLLPGVQKVGEGAAGYNVRGSPADQNIFYIDKVPVYNTSHVFGFFSAFNSEAIQEFSISKSNIPAEYGGRLASVFDITTKKGDMKNYKLRGTISPITGSLLAEGPIKKESSSFLLSLRSTYSDYILRLIPDPNYNKSKVYFGDAMVKFAFDINEQNKVEAFGYYSLDRINFAGRSFFDMNNQGASLSWKRFFNRKHNLDVSAVYSEYNLDLDNRDQLSQAYSQNSSVRHLELRTSFSYRPTDRHLLKIGGNSVLYQNDRGSVLPSHPASLITPQELNAEQALESGLFISEEWKVNSRLAFIAGIRYNFYNYLGPQDVLDYDPEQPLSSQSVLDTLSFNNFEPIASYQNFDYRAGMKYSFSPNLSAKASISRIHQYIFLLSNTIALSPTDKWKLTDSHIKPMRGDQLSLGVYSALFDKKVELSFETYYKQVDRLVEYKDGAELITNANPEQDILQGNLDSYGFEFMLKKLNGRMNGWVNYSYSRAIVLAESAFPTESINFGNPYAANYDKPHAFNLVVNYRFIRRLSASGNIVYSSGQPVTYPTNIYYQNGIKLISYSQRNEFRIPNYFRTDLSFKLEGNLKARKKMHGVWIFSIYNLTGRKNAYNVYFSNNGGTFNGYKVSIFARPIFSVSYNFKFGNYEY